LYYAETAPRIKAIRTSHTRAETSARIPDQPIDVRQLLALVDETLVRVEA